MSPFFLAKSVARVKNRSTKKTNWRWRAAQNPVSEAHYSQSSAQCDNFFSRMLLSLFFICATALAEKEWLFVV